MKKQGKHYYIAVHNRDPEDNCFCAIVMAYNRAVDVNDQNLGGWYNTGIVIREPSASAAFHRAHAQACIKFADYDYMFEEPADDALDEIDVKTYPGLTFEDMSGVKETRRPWVTKAESSLLVDTVVAVFGCVAIVLALVHLFSLVS